MNDLNCRESRLDNHQHSVFGGKQLFLWYTGFVGGALCVGRD